jgi:hypothetical protein
MEAREVVTYLNISRPVPATFHKLSLWRLQLGDRARVATCHVASQPEHTFHISSVCSPALLQTEDAKTLKT